MYMNNVIFDLQLSQLQKLVNNLDSKVNEMVIKSSEDLQILKDSQKITQVVLDELQLVSLNRNWKYNKMCMYLIAYILIGN